MISLTTAAITMILYALPISYIDNREFPGPHQAPLSGPVGYLALAFGGPVAYFPTIVLFLNNWLVESLLVGFVFDSVARVSKPDCCFSSIVVLSFTT